MRSVDRLPEVMVEFKTIRERELFSSYASNIEGGSLSIDPVIPCFLRGLAQKLNRYAYVARQKAAAAAGEDKSLRASTYIRLSDEDLSLHLAIRRTKQDEWEFYSEDELPPLTDKPKRKKQPGCPFT